MLPRLQGPLPPGLRTHYAPRSEVCPGEPLLIQCQENGQLQVALALWGVVQTCGPESNRLVYSTARGLTLL